MYVFLCIHTYIHIYIYIYIILLFKLIYFIFNLFPVCLELRAFVDHSAILVLYTIIYI